jgi:hypothetical protein
MLCILGSFFYSKKPLRLASCEQDLATFLQELSVSSGITRYAKGSKKHLDDPVPNGEFPVLHWLGIGSSVLGSFSDCIRK